MKKEIEVWVNRESFGSQSGTVWFGEEVKIRNPTATFFKATLIIEEPEPEVTITPSELRSVIEGADLQRKFTPSTKTADFAIRQLFGEGR